MDTKQPTAPPFPPSNAEQGYIHSIETGGTVDGPGIRFVIFFSGCPLRCVYCHNPDTREKTSGTLMQTNAVVAEARRYADFMRRTGGGVTLSGGDPLFQTDFAQAILEGCKKAGMHTALDTSGFLGRRVPSALLDATDLVLLDIKSFDAETYKRVTMHKLAPTLDFAQLLAERKKPVWIRCVIVPNLTDDLETLSRLASHLQSLGNVEKVELLPFHKLGEHKWKASGMPYELIDTQPPTTEQMDAIREVFEKEGLVTG